MVEGSKVEYGILIFLEHSNKTFISDGGKGKYLPAVPLQTSLIFNITRIERIKKRKEKEDF